METLKKAFKGIGSLFKIIIDFFAKLWARFYNWIPQNFKITVFNSTSTLFTTLILLSIQDLKTILANLTDPKEAAVYVFAIAILSGLVNELQKKLTQRGDVALARQGDTNILEKYTDKVNDAVRVKQITEKARI